MAFEPIAEVLADPSSTFVYEEGWQSWSPVGVYVASESSPRPPDALRHTMGWRPGKALPLRGFQGEGVLAVAPYGEPVRAWFSPQPESEVASIRLEPRDDRLVVSADGRVDHLAVDGTIDDVLAAIGDRLKRRDALSVPPGWCSWSAYFRRVSEADVVENLKAAELRALPIEIVQIDDGFQSGIGDWLDVDRRFGSLERTAEWIADAGKRAGVWTAPFLIGDRSSIASEHPEWLVHDAAAGWNWGQRLRAIDVTHPAAAAHLESVYRTLTEWGFSYHKLDFLYAGALDGGRHEDCSPLEAYRKGLDLIRRATGPGAILLGCGAPLLPSIGLVDAMRIGPDVLSEQSTRSSDAGAPDLRNLIRVTRARAWMHARLWASDPDCLVARPEIRQRETWASHIAAYGGLAFSSDRLDALDERGVELTRRVLIPSSTTPVTPR